MNRSYKPEKQLKEKDILYVRSGSYRIWSVVMFSSYALKVILTREILVLRVKDDKNKYGITREYLMYALSHKLSFEQSVNKIFIDKTLPNIADRWKEIEIPIYRDKKRYELIKSKVSISEIL